ncbi:MAG: AI-2E family transporter, partial [bacterium]
MIQRLIRSGAAIANILSIVAITPIVAFYMMRDWQGITRRIDDLLPRRQADVIRTLLGQMDQAIAGFIRGQSMVCLCLGGFYALGLSVVGREVGCGIGATAGVLSGVPYV